MTAEIETRRDGWDILIGACHKGGFLKPYYGRMRKAPFTAVIKAGDKQIKILLPAEITDWTVARAVASDLILNSIYDDWELPELAQPHADHEILENDESEKVEKKIAELKEQLPKKLERITKSNKDDEEKKEWAANVNKSHEELVEKLSNPEWPAIEELMIENDPLWVWAHRLFDAIDACKLKDDWEYEPSGDNGLSCTVSLHKASTEKDADPEFLFKVEHEEEFDEEIIEKLMDTKNRRGKKEMTRERALQKLMKRAMAESIVNEIVEAGLMDHAAAGKDMLIKRKRDKEQAVKDKAKAQKKEQETKAAAEKKKKAEKEAKIKKEAENKKKNKNKGGFKKENNDNNQRSNTVGNRKRQGPPANYYRNNNQPAYLNGQPPMMQQPATIYMPMPQPMMQQPTMQQFQYKQPKQEWANTAPQQNNNNRAPMQQSQRTTGSQWAMQNSAPQQNNNNGNIMQMHQQELAKLQAQQRQQMEQLMARQQAQMGYAPSNANKW